MPRLITVSVLLFILYAGSYVAFRSSNLETWERDGRYYVIFPKDHAGTALYYAWRPLSYLDNSITGVGAHIGPHEG